MGKRNSWLTVDQGNTSLSVAWFTLEAQLVLHATWHCTDLAGLERVQTGPVDAVYCSSVRGKQAALKLTQGLEQRFGMACSPGPGLKLDTADSTGSDRLYAARAADELTAGRPAIVVDVGTAMTVDLVCGGVFKGGAIAPGPYLMAQSLGAGAAQLFEVEPRPGVSALGLDTKEALEAGVTFGLRGSARALVEGLAGELSGSVKPKVFVTGGARELLFVPEVFLPHFELIEVPLLVHLGLLFAASELCGRQFLGASFFVQHGSLGE